MTSPPPRDGGRFGVPGQFRDPRARVGGCGWPPGSLWITWVRAPGRSTRPAGAGRYQVMRRPTLLPAPRGAFRFLAGLCGLVLLVPAIRSQVVAAVAPDRGAPVVYTSATDSGPLRWKGCGPVRVLVNPGPFGTTAVEDVRAALAEVTTFTGLSFVIETSREVPTTTWARSSGTTPPVLIGWVTPEETDLFTKAAGATVANPAGTGQQRGIATGAIGLNVTRGSEFSRTSGPGRTVRNLLLHEIGHLLGLDHSEHAVLMNPVIDDAAPDGFTGEEVAALAALYQDCR